MIERQWKPTSKPSGVAVKVEKKEAPQGAWAGLRPAYQILSLSIAGDDHGLAQIKGARTVEKQRRGGRKARGWTVNRKRRTRPSEAHELERAGER